MVSCSALLLLALMCGAASAAPEQHATRIIRFLDEAGVERLGSPADGDGVSELIEGDSIHGSHRLTGERATVARLLSPITRPPVIYCVGLNYPDHAHSVQNGTLPTSPIIFFKNRNAASGPGTVEIPPASTHPDYEAELVFVVSKTAKDVKAADALEYVLGYTVGNDVSSRHWQKQAGAGQWIKGKSFDTFCPLGPVLVTRAAIPDPQALRVTTRVNGAVQQDEATADMIFTVAECIAWLSDNMTLLPGTVVMTGTPSGVAAGRTPPNFLKVGDVVKCEISQIGTIRNTVVMCPHTSESSSL